jgi:hypothetical protein
VRGPALHARKPLGDDRRGRVREAFAIRAEWRSSAYGTAVVLKLAVFGVVLAMSALHDFSKAKSAVT